MKTKIFLPVMLSVGILAAACGDQTNPSQNLDMIAAQQVAAQRAAGGGSTVTVTNQNTVTNVTTATVSSTATVTSTSTVTATVRE